MPKILKK